MSQLVRASERIYLGESASVALSLREAEAVSLAAEPTSIDELLRAGFSEPEVSNLLSRRLLEYVDGTDRNLWWTYNWLRAYDFFERVRADRRTHTGPEAVRGCTPHRTRSIVNTLLKRRSRRFFSKTSVSAQALRRITKRLQEELRKEPCFSAFLVVQAIDDLEPGCYRLSDRGEWTAIPTGAPQRLQDSAQGMWWVRGGGGVLFFAVNMAPFKQSATSARDYFQALLALGRLGQTMLEELYAEGLAAWMTPAVDESVAAELFDINSRDLDVLELLKFGIPRALSQKGVRGV